MKNIFSADMFARVSTFSKAHKFVSAGAVLVALAVGWWAYGAIISTNGETRYVLAQVQRSTIIASVSASGQVSASNQVDILSGVSGDVISVPVKAGQKVAVGALIAQIDPGDAAYELETERISYEKLTTVDSDDLAQAQTAVADAYTDARATLTTTSSELSDQLEDLKSFFGKNAYLTSQDYSRSKQEKAYQDQAEKSYYAAEAAVKKFNATTRSIALGSDHTKIQAIIAQGYEAALLTAQAAKDAKDAMSYIRDREDLTNVAADNAHTLAGTIVTAVNSSVSSIAATRDTVKDADDALKDLTNGPDTLDLRTAQLNLRQKEEALANYSIRAPFAGTIATLDVKRGDTLSSNAAVATLITDQKIAELSLNEVDVAKVQLGDKATLTFDAVEDLTLAGEVAEIDAIGTVEQGVVSYTIKIGFDTQESRVKPGMTVNAAIQTDVRQDVLTVPSSAVKTQNGVSYVQVFEPALTGTGGTGGVVSSVAPTRVEVTTGISGDTNIEILSGVTEGQQIVTRTISGTAATNTTTSNGGFGGGMPL